MVINDEGCACWLSLLWLSAGYLHSWVDRSYLSCINQWNLTAVSFGARYSSFNKYFIREMYHLSIKWRFGIGFDASHRNLWIESSFLGLASVISNSFSFCFHFYETFTGNILWLIWKYAFCYNLPVSFC